MDMEEVRTLRVRLSKALVLIQKQVAAIKELTQTNEKQAREVEIKLNELDSGSQEKTQIVAKYLRDTQRSEGNSVRQG